MKPMKEYEVLHCKLEKEISKLLNQICKETGLSKTVATERAIQMYYTYFKETGKI